MSTTVVISNYNYAKYVGSAIESCLNQTLKPKIIVVDDCSIDESWNVIKEYVAHDEVLAVRLKDNSRGNARGKNVGICLAKTDFVTCLDSDDMLLSHSIESRIKAMQDCDIVHGFAYPLKTEKPYQKIDVAAISACPYVVPDKVKSKFSQPESRWAFVMDASAVLVRRSVYNEVGLYDEEMRWKIDREMWWRMLSHGQKRAMVPRYVSIYRRHKEQLTSGTRQSWKSPKKCSRLMRLRKQTRKGEINSSNTIMVSEYPYENYIDEVIDG